MVKETLTLGWFASDYIAHRIEGGHQCLLRSMAVLGASERIYILAEQSARCLVFDGQCMEAV